jgi:uncharacterized membrane protein
MKHPILSIPKTKSEIANEMISFGVLLTIFVYLFTQWSKIPNRIPIHFNVSDIATGWGSKGVLFVMPLITVLLFIGFTVLSKFPHVFNYPVEITLENAKKQYLNARLLLSWITLEIVVMFNFFEFEFINTVLGHSGIKMIFLPFFILILLGTIVYFIIRSHKI